MIDGDEVDVLALTVPVAVEEREVVLTRPDVWADLSARQTDFLVEFPLEGIDVALTDFETATGQSPLRPGRKLETNEEDRWPRAEHHGPGRRSDSEIVSHLDQSPGVSRKPSLKARYIS